MSNDDKEEGEGSDRTDVRKVAEERWRKTLEEAGYDPDNGTVTIPLKRGHFRLLLALSEMVYDDPRAILARLLEGAIEGTTSAVDPNVAREIKEAYLQEEGDPQ